MKTTALLLSFLSSCGRFVVTDGYPTGAAQCIAGDLAPGGPHTGFGMGSLEDSGNYQIMIDGTSDLGSVMVQPGMSHTITLEGMNSASFKGFLVRMSATGADVSGSLSNTAGSDDLQLMDSTGEDLVAFPGPGACAETVAGATHTNNNEKTSIAVEFELPADSDATTVDAEITVVVAANEYYYSKYALAIEGPAESMVPAPSPTNAPDSAGVTASGTIFGTAATAALIVLAMI